MKYLVLLASLFTLPLSSYCFSKDTGNFKEWNYSPTAVFGLVKLDTTTERWYYKISRDNDVTTIERINPKGLLIETIIMEFSKGVIARRLEIDRWNDTDRIFKFQKIADNEFLVTGKENGKNAYFPCRGAKYHYDNGLLTTITYVSNDNEPMNIQDGTAIIRAKRYTDEERFSMPQEEEYFDENDRPITRSDYHKVYYERDQRCNIITERYFDKKNTPIKNRSGVAVTRNKFDAADNRVLTEYFDETDRAVYHLSGPSKAHYIYQKGLCTEYLLLDTLGIVQQAGSQLSYSIVRHLYDSSGNEVRTGFYSDNDFLVKTNSGYAEVLYKFSPDNMVIEKAFYDENRDPVTDRDGIHKYKYVRDQKNRITEEYFFDVKDHPRKDKFDEVYSIKYQYDNDGLMLSKSFWEDAFKKMNRWNGFHESKYKYNKDGQEIEWAVYDQDGNLFKTQGGYSKQVQEYNDRGLVEERKWLHNDRPAFLNDSLSTVRGYHSIKYYYNKYGKVSYLEYFDIKGRPANVIITMGTNKMRVHKVEFVYSGTAIVSENYFVSDLEVPIMTVDCYKSEHVNTTGVTLISKIVNK